MKHPKKKTLSEKMREKSTLKQRQRDRKQGLRQRINSLVRELQQGKIAFEFRDLGKIRVKQWSGYYSYLLTVAREEVQDD